MDINTHEQLINRLLTEVKDKSSLDIFSFLNNRLSHSSNKELKEFIKEYLNFIYGIESHHNSVTEQIDHFSFLSNLDLKDGCKSLMCEILDILNKSRELTKLDNVSEATHYKSIESRLSIEIDSIAPGMNIVLSDKIRDDYRNTKFFDKNTRNPSWSLLYKSNLHDFEFVEFYALNFFTNKIETLDRVYRIFSNTSDTVEHVEQNSSGKIIVYTSVFKIDWINATAANEVNILKTPLRANNPLLLLKDKLEDYSTGIYPYSDFSKSLSKWIFTHIHFIHPEWVRFTRSINGIWCRVNKNRHAK